MKLSQAFKVVAEEYDAGNTSPYLCFATMNSGYRSSAKVGAIPIDLRQEMSNEVREMIGGRVYAYDDSEREGRLEMLLLLSEMAKDKERWR